MLPHERLPEERHQLDSPFLRCCSPILLVGRLLLELDSLLECRLEDSQIQATEDLLDAHAVHRDENHVSDGRLSEGPVGARDDTDQHTGYHAASQIMHDGFPTRAIGCEGAFGEAASESIALRKHSPVRTARSADALLAGRVLRPRSETLTCEPRNLTQCVKFRVLKSSCPLLLICSSMNMTVLRFARRLRVSEGIITGVLVAGHMPVHAAPGQARSSTASGFATIAVRADAARDAGRLDEASGLYRQALALQPDWTEGWWSLGTILYDRDLHADAARAFQRVVSQNPKNGTAHLMLALCEYQLDRNASATQHIQAAKTLGVQKDDQLLHVLVYHEAMLLLRAGRYERAIEAARPLVAADVEDDNLDVALGLAVLLIRPNDAPPEGSPRRQILLRAGRAERHSLSKQFAEAREHYSALVQEAPSFPNVHYAYGRFLLATEDRERAVAEFREEIKRDPSHVRARMQIAAARYRVDSAAGIPFAQEVVKLQPDYPFGHYLLGLLYFDTGDITRAIPALEAAARMVPDEPQFQFTLGNAYARVGRKEDAARARAAFQRLRGNDTATSSPRLDLDEAEPTPRAGKSRRPR
ncbi:MAG: tetratricopeptide repeat protein [Luteitalea sp.]|nr:tetratricopeptide repeat protein [Luteitalea sp.]